MTLVATDRLYLRDFVPDDALAMDAVFSDPQVMRYGDGAQPEGFAQAWIARIAVGGDGLGRWALVERSSDLVTGYVGLVHDPTRCALSEVELGYRLSRRFWGQGYATEACRALLPYGLATMAWPTIIAIIDPKNVGSIRVAEKIGMVFERTILLAGYDHLDHVYAISGD